MLETIEKIIGDTQAVQTSIIFLHGLGADGHDFQTLPSMLNLSKNSGIRFIFPHAPIIPVTINGGAHMRAWYDILHPAFSTQEDHLGIQNAQIQISALIHRENERGVPIERIFLGGFSQGAAVSLYVGLRFPQRLAGIIALSGYLPMANFLDKERSSSNENTPIFMAHGTLDPIVPISLGILSREKLTSLGYNVDWHDYFMGHQICPQEMDELGLWTNNLR